MAAKPLLSACLIVKDERDVIQRCLGSLSDWVDEIVVYDTGSTDGTQDLAADAGARVVQGAWRDDFGWARNQALSHCAGQWALCIDADEVVTHIDRDALRKQLGKRDVDALQLTMESYRDASGAVAATHQNMRLLRMGKVQWEGRLHEQVRALKGRLKSDVTTAIRLGHWGYIPEVIAARDKLTRNVTIAQKAVAEDPSPRAQVELGRALTAAGRHEEALPHFVAARDAEAPYVVRTAARQAIGTLLRLGRPADAEDWLTVLRDASTAEGTAKFLQARVLAAGGDAEGALEVAADLLAAPGISDDDGISTSPARARAALATDLWNAGFSQEGTDLLLAGTDDLEVAVVPRLVNELNELGQLERAADLLGPDRPGDWLERVLAGLVADQTEGLGDLLDVLGDRWPGAQHLLALASLASPHLTLAQADRWTTTLEAAGLKAHAPLRLRAADADLPVADRVLAAARLADSSEEEGLELVRDLAPQVPEAELFDLLGSLDEHAHAGLEPFVLSAITTPSRCIAMAEALIRHDEPKVAGDILQYALDQPDVSPQQRGEIAMIQQTLPTD